MNMQQFINQFGLKEARRLANAADTDLNYLKQIAWGLRQPGISLLRRLTIESGRRLTIKGLRPDIYEMVVNEIAAEQQGGNKTMESVNGKDQPPTPLSEAGTIQCEHIPDHSHAA